MSTLGKDMARGCGRAMTIRVIATLIVVPLGCLLIFLPLYLVTSLDFPVWVMGFSAVMFLVLILGGGMGYVVFVMRRRRTMMDAAFASLGLEGGAYQDMVPPVSRHVTRAPGRRLSATWAVAGNRDRYAITDTLGRDRRAR